jgi:hypothetical protein
VKHPDTSAERDLPEIGAFVIRMSRPFLWKLILHVSCLCPALHKHLTVCPALLQKDCWHHPRQTLWVLLLHASLNPLTPTRTSVIDPPHMSSVATIDRALRGAAAGTAGTQNPTLVRDPSHVMHARVITIGLE